MYCASGRGKKRSQQRAGDSADVCKLMGISSSQADPGPGPGREAASGGLWKKIHLKLAPVTTEALLRRLWEAVHVFSG